MNLSIPIDVLNHSDLTKENFQENYLKAKKPVVIKGLLESCPAGTSWTLDQMFVKLGKHQINVFDNTKKDGTSFLVGHKKVSMSQMLELVRDNKPSELRMFVNSILKKDKELAAEFPCPDFFKTAFQLSGLMFIGGKGSIVPLHYDFMLDDGILTHFYGRKEVILIENDQSRSLYQLPLTTISQVNLFEPDYNTFPALANITGYRVVLEHGDTLFIPSGYWHQLKYVDASMSVAFRSWNTNPLVTANTAIKRIAQIAVDKTLAFAFGDKWLDYKQEIARKRAGDFPRKPVFNL